MERRRIVWALVLAVAIVATLGVGLAAAGTAPGPGDRAAAWEQMHGSPWMRAMHAQMPDDLQAQCDAMHAQMVAGLAGTGPAMGGPSTGAGMGPMMGGPGSMGPGMMPRW